MQDDEPGVIEDVRWVAPDGRWAGPPVLFIEREQDEGALARRDANVNVLGAAMLAWAVQVAQPEHPFYASVAGLIGLDWEEARLAEGRLEEMGYRLVRRWYTANDHGEEVLWPKT